MIEKEIKIAIEFPPLNQLMKHLSKDYSFLGIETQEDIYFNFIYRNFKITDEAVRLRKINDKIELTYKGPKISSSIKAREEITVRLDSINNIVEFLNKLGLYPVMTVKKIRYNYSDGSFIVSLDYVEELGEFVEIEAKNEALDESKIQNYISEFIRKYNIKGKPTTKSYLELLIDKHESNKT
ncbi:adenylate cyclase [Sulfolobus sp. A20]|uniref:class IV adenylate cyclase n=1 Tax=Saccharolobus sp. A20 TaxID=1891280 RepID=UPI000846035B|nr:class IV adenylate cyclase [Sulfolobus sp. A20]TRM76137.1 class IV adenylate cyclase [Sulfolobus sp. A20-N-F8]TRM78503.1 class IV adenylate cyclase [Sulfolobus sp. B5]TRM80891.1 class IV adenylate cyclase [Sulfolobus sp. D5]TRM83933.1 class IV adenylate cyclase [Sulfolobus sp. A20-N-F6]TRM88732.1 class IV adenylate cyclase [Sulfolobus sp. C3]TRM89142.1 class IV adenylate cyclase [Sulfolobus sp. E3]TRM98647.1 class IV adenylate cyclase [Sulfolobus sp. E1]TRM99068.1 class IV adenylate cycl